MIKQDIDRRKCLDLYLTKLLPSIIYEDHLETHILKDKQPTTGKKKKRLNAINQWSINISKMFGFPEQRKLKHECDII